MEDSVKKDLIEAFKLNEQIEEQTTSSDAGAYVTPQVWAKSPSDLKSVNDPKWPKYGGPGGQYVRVKDKCKTFPYCNQGDINALEFYGPTKPKKKTKKKRTKKRSTTPLGRRKRKITRDLVRTQKIKTPRGKHYNIGRWINENNGYLYYNKGLTSKEVQSAILENKMRKNITDKYAPFSSYRTQGNRLEETTRLALHRYLFEDCATCDGAGGYYCGDDINNWTAYSPDGCVPWYYLGDNLNDCQDGADEIPANRNPMTGAGVNACGAAGTAGCTDPTADNYDSNVVIDDGSCTFTVLGCIDINANNFDSLATVDDGSCLYDVLGCTDSLANNYNSSATVDDGTCDYGIYGCTESIACNYNPDATVDDGSCIIPTASKPCDPNVIDGCMDVDALNYNPQATVDDGSCIKGIKGCMDKDAINFNPDATIDDPNACKYPQENPCIEIGTYLMGLTTSTGTAPSKTKFCDSCSSGTGLYANDPMCTCCEEEPQPLTCQEFNEPSNQAMATEICNLCDLDGGADANNPLLAMYCDCCEDTGIFTVVDDYCDTKFDALVSDLGTTDDDFCQKCEDQTFNSNYTQACKCCEETILPPGNGCDMSWESSCSETYLSVLTGGVTQLQNWLEKRQEGFESVGCQHLQNVINWLTQQLNDGVVGPNKPNAGQPLNQTQITRKTAKRKWAVCQADKCNCKVNIPALTGGSTPGPSTPTGGPTTKPPCDKIEQYVADKYYKWPDPTDGGKPIKLDVVHFCEKCKEGTINDPMCKCCDKPLLEERKRKITNMKLTEQSKKPQGYRIYAKAHEMSGKSNDEGLSIAKKKIADFMKNDGETEVEPKMYRNSKEQDEFVEDVYYSSGQTGLKFNPELTDKQKERMDRHLKGSKLTGNAVTGDVANVMTTNSEGGANKTGEMLSKAAKRRAEKEEMGMRMANNDRRYTPDTQVTTNVPLVKLKEDVIDTSKQILELTPARYKKDGVVFEITNGKETKRVKYESFKGKKGGHIIILESSNPSKLNEQLSRMKTLMSHSTKTRHDKFR